MTYWTARFRIHRRLRHRDHGKLCPTCVGFIYELPRGLRRLVAETSR